MFLAENLLRLSFKFVKTGQIISTVQVKDTKFDEDGPTVVTISSR